MCDNVSQTHDPVVLHEDNSAILVYCPQCDIEQRIGKDTKGNPEHRLYSEWFKRDLLQPDVPLFSKYAGKELMRIL